MSTTLPQDIAIPEGDSRAAYLTLKERIAAVPQNEIVQVNLDIHGAVRVVTGCLPKVRPYRDPAAKSLTDYDIRWFDDLGTITLALLQTHLDYVGRAPAPDEIDAIAAELGEAKDLILTDVVALVKRKAMFFDMSDLRGGNGYRNLEFDALLLTNALRPAYESIRNRTSITMAEIEHTQTLAHRLMRAVSERDNGTKSPGLGEERGRAFTLFLRAVSEVRRALTYLRWHEGDVDMILPSLYGKRGASAKSNKEESAQKPNPQPAAQPAATQTGDKPADAAPLATGAAGLPDSNPFGD